MKPKSIIILILLLGGGLFLATFGCCAGAVFLGYRGYRDTEAAISPKIDGMFQAIDNDRFGKTYELETAPELRQVASKEQYEQLGRTIKTRLGSLKTKSMKSFNARQNNADSYVDVVYSATFEKGSGTIKARLKKSAGDWVFVQFQVDSPEFLKDLAVASCPKCGKPRPANAQFCPACGVELSTRESSVPEEPKLPVENP
jgi:hypothetical protein